MTSKNNSKDLEFERPIELQGKKDEGFLIQCSECHKNVILPASPPDCKSCLERLDLCRHGIACVNCSNRLILEWINEGNVKAGQFPFESIKEMIWEKYKKEVFINKDGYLEIKK